MLTHTALFRLRFIVIFQNYERVDINYDIPSQRLENTLQCGIMSVNMFHRKKYRGGGMSTLMFSVNFFVGAGVEGGG
jgi:hypothetical protein